MARQLTSTFTLPSRPGGYTVADLDALPEMPGLRIELIDGVLMMSGVPRWRHQLVITELAQVLERVCPPELLVHPQMQDLRRGDDTNLVRTCSWSGSPTSTWTVMSRTRRCSSSRSSHRRAVAAT